MVLILPFAKVTAEDRGRVGGKCYALAVVARNGMNVPETLCAFAKACEAFVSCNSLRERARLELNP